MKKTLVLPLAALMFSLSSCAADTGGSAPSSAAQTAVITTAATAAATKDAEEYIDLSADVYNVAYTPEQALVLYCECMKKGYLKTFNTLFSEQWVSQYGAYTVLHPQDIYDVQLSCYDEADDTDTAVYQLTFKIKDGDFFFDKTTPGEAAYAFFPRLVREDEVWKIDEMPTSPPASDD